MNDSNLVEDTGDLSLEGLHEPLVSVEPLTQDGAKELTRSIRDAAEVIWVLIARAHAGKAWLALGYDSWADYVREEFNMSRSRSYQLLDQAKVIEAINKAMPSGAEVALSESSARDLKFVIQEAVPEIKEKTKGLDPEEAVKVTQEIIAKYEAKQTTDSVASDNIETEAQSESVSVSDDDSAHDADETTGTIAREDDSSENTPAPEHQATSSTEDSVDTSDRVVSVPPAPAMSQEELASIRKNVNAAHDIYTALSALSSLPADLSAVIKIIPQERRTIVSSNLPQAAANLETFTKLWAENETQDDSDSSSDASR